MCIWNYDWQQDLAIQEAIAQSETAWMNPYVLPFAVVDGVSQLVVSDEMIDDAAKRLQRFAPFLQKCFPETEETGGLIESPLKEIPAMQKKLEET